MTTTFGATSFDDAPGWRVHGESRGVPGFPAAPPTCVHGLLDVEQRAAVDGYRGTLDDLAASRAAEARCRRALDAAHADDAAAADAAYVERLGVAPVSCRGLREVELAAQRAYTAAIERAARRAFGSLLAALRDDQRRLIADAWTGLADDPKRTPENVRAAVERVEWALHVHESPAGRAKSAVLAAIDELPYRGWQQPLDVLLDELGEQVAASLAAFDEAA
jgi:hypothetical protein